MDSVSLNATSLTLKEGDTHTLTATVSPGNATDKTVTWSSSNVSVVTVSNGLLKAVQAGSATITAKADGKSATCSVTVEKPFVAVTSVELDQTTLDLTEGDEVTLKATVKPDDATDKTVTWTSSDPAVATVADGKVTAVKEGAATITAKAGEKTATCAVTVKKPFVAVTSVTLDKTKLEMTEGDEATLTATVKPDDATDKTVTWTSSDAAVATVKDGKVKAVKAGTATITATAGEKTATCEVTVKKPFVAVTSVTLDKTKLELTEGGEYTLTATVKPDNATDKTVTWSSSNSAVATVKDGKVTAVKAGTATITAKAGEKTATCAVTVTKATVPVTSITLNKTTLSLTEGEDYTLTATVKPDDATDKTVTWSSSNAAVATVKDGKVTAVKAGTATITAKAGEKTAICAVTVKKATVAVTSITLDKTKLELTEGGEYTLTATVKPDDATDKTVTWSSSNAAVATVKDGKVTAVTAGTATITAKAGEKMATCAVTVTKATVPVTSITLNKTTLSLTEGEDYTLTATVKPDDATDKTVTWSSSNAAVATVKDGKVTAVTAGTATITAKAGEKMAICAVTVKKATIEVTSVTLDKSSLSLKVNEEQTLTATVKPDNATDKTVTWSSSNTSVATVTGGTVRGIKAGTATITAKAGTQSATCQVTVTAADPAPVIHLGQSTLTIPGAMAFTYSKVTYTIDHASGGLPDVVSNSDWLSLQETGETYFKFFARKNSGSSMRTGTFTLTYKNAEPQVVTVHQYPASYCQLIIPETNIQVANEAATYRIDYSLTRPLDGYGFRFQLDPSSSSSWITPQYTDGVLSFTVATNNATTRRTCQLKITYEAGESPVTMTITQLGKPAGPPDIDVGGLEGANQGVSPYGEDACVFPCYVVNPVAGVQLETKADVSWIANIRKHNDFFYCFTAARNLSGSPRTGHIDLTYGTVHKQLTFLQDTDDNIIILSPENLTLNYAAQPVSFTVTMPDGTDYSKLVVEEDSSTGIIKNLKRTGNKVTFDIKENNSGASRNTSITVSLGSISRTCHITQTYEAPVVTISPNSLTLNYQKQESVITLQVQNPRSGGASVIEVNNTDWLWCSASGDIVRINVAENSTGKSRSSVVEIGYVGMTGKIQVPVTQTSSKTALTITPSSLSCDYKAQTKTFAIQVTDPLDWVYVGAESNAQWITVKSVSNVSATVSLTQNYSSKSRSSGITFTYGDLTVVVPVTQDANPVSDGFVDLGLPSGTLWATCNLGANEEYEAGDYYAWGEISPKSKFSWSNYKWGRMDNLTKYNASDKKTVLDPADDPAYQKNHDWSMPTKEQFIELLEVCYWEWVTTPVPGYKVKSPYGDSYIFLPGVGYKDNSWQENWAGYYWSKTLYTGFDYATAYYLDFIEADPQYGPGEPVNVSVTVVDRCIGAPIRPVKKK